MRLARIPFLSTVLTVFGIFFALYSDRYFESAMLIPNPVKPMIVVANVDTTMACPMTAGSVILAIITQNIAPIPKFVRLSSIRKYDPLENLLNTVLSCSMYILFTLLYLMYS